MENGILDNIPTEGTYIRPWTGEKLKDLGCQIDRDGNLSKTRKIWT